MAPAGLVAAADVEAGVGPVAGDGAAAVPAVGIAGVELFAVVPTSSLSRLRAVFEWYFGIGAS